MAAILDGVWQFEIALQSGKDITAVVKSWHLLIQDGMFWIKAGDVVLDHGTITHAPGNRIEIFGLEGPGKGKTLKAIFKIEDDKMVICYNLQPGGNYPEGFTSPEGSGLFLVHYKLNKL